MSVKWLRQLQEHHPALAKRAKAMNKEDGFIMYNEDDKKKKEKKVKKSSSSS